MILYVRARQVRTKSLSGARELAVLIYRRLTREQRLTLVFACVFFFYGENVGFSHV